MSDGEEDAVLSEAIARAHAILWPDAESVMLTEWAVVAAWTPAESGRTVYAIHLPAGQPAHHSAGLARYLANYLDDSEEDDE